jgi:hypothetical protein
MSSAIDDKVADDARLRRMSSSNDDMGADFAYDEQEDESDVTTLPYRGTRLAALRW